MFPLRNSFLATLLLKETMGTSPLDCSRVVLEAVPHLMRVIRQQVRTRSSPELTMPQFRSLAFLGRNEDAMLADVANFLGITPPAASKLIDALVGYGYVARDAGTQDRRRIALKLTPAGRRRYNQVLSDAESYLSDRLQDLPGSARDEIVRGLRALHTLFEDPSEVRRSTAKRRPQS